ncbi:MAG: magnesium-translocating P-type ATPase [Rickettsiales bacterium]|jgi:Mg2+-importing ATPase|nr:magnesium-translocating P-type ATPase [Rickettsiales bacterium]
MEKSLKKDKKKNELVEVIKNKLIESASMTATKMVDNLDINLKKGKSSDFVEEWQEENGYNEIIADQEHTLLTGIIDSFFNPFGIVLIALSVISFFTGDKTAGGTILFLVFLSGFIKLVQEEKSNQASEKLKTMINTTTSVLRDGRRKEINIDDVIVGDVVYLSAGDIIPADLRIIEAKDLFISQASLTGESEPVEKIVNLDKEKTDKTSINPLELENLCFMGTNVVSGTATAVVIGVGLDTYFGVMSKSILRTKTKTSFDKGVSDVSWFLIKFMVVMVVLVFIINGYYKNNWIEAFMFAISIAVGLTPEMLPVIVSANLAKGAITMSKKKTIVKNINAIQNFGAMDILCSDKTGTLTENMVVLQYYYNMKGEEDDRILRHAFLNSQFQTGLKNLIDLAIIDKAQESETLVSLNYKYKKIDELPFDFNRRRMSVLLEDKSGKVQLITKGALTEIMQVCKWVEIDGKIIELNDEVRKEAEKIADDLSADGMRVLALAQKNEVDPSKPLTKDMEKDMVLIGYLSFLDPPKNSSKSAIEALKNYNVKVKVLTGDNAPIARYVCHAVNIDNSVDVLNGNDIEKLTDEELKIATRKVDIFAKLSPQQKIRVIKVLKSDGHVVGYMGDGINDAGAMKESDVAISVDSAVDIAKESADIILLKKDLNVLVQGVIEGRKIFCNIIKYVKMTISSNFGNMFSVLFASVFLPFLPMLPVQILLLNIFYDLSQTTIPWDNIDEDYIQKQKKWNTKSIMSFMLFVGPVSSIFDLLLFYIMYNYFGVSTHGIALFQTGWFVASIVTQTIIIYLIRTTKKPFIESNPSIYVFYSTTMALVISMVIPYLDIGKYVGLFALPLIYYGWLVCLCLLYVLLIQVTKVMYKKLHHGEWL